MDGVFMKKIIKLITIILIFVFALELWSLWQDRKALQENLVRLHVVANSDSQEDQNIKHQVKDAIVAYLQPIMDQFSNKKQAVDYLQENLSSLQGLSNQVLDKLGSAHRAVVSLMPEEFDTRIYDTFALPAGVYDALRIEIGEAAGKNWWCVVFPSLCLPGTSRDFQYTAVSSGFSEPLTNTISNNGGYRLRFFFLDCIGKIENLLF